jgi:hypothetical protein
MKREKTKEERLTEGIHLLKQLKEANVKETGKGFQELKQKISEWVATGNSWEGTINFAEHGRIGEVELPRYNNKAAGMGFKMHQH